MKKHIQITLALLLSASFNSYAYYCDQTAEGTIVGAVDGAITGAIVGGIVDGG